MHRWRAYLTATTVAGALLAGLSLFWLGVTDEEGMPVPSTLATEGPGPKTFPLNVAQPTAEEATQAPPLLPPPASRLDSNDPGERAVAQGQVLQSRLVRSGGAAGWRREMLVKSPVQDRLLYVQEELQHDAQNGGWIRLGMNLYIADQAIVRAVPGVSAAALSARLGQAGISLLEPIAEGLYTVRLPESDLDALPKGLELLAGMRDFVALSEPDGVGFGAGVPNDASFSTQWGHHNTGQSSGTVDVDVDAPEFWDIIENAPGVVIAVLDSGLNLTHPDLQNIAWTNPGEIAGNGIDDDASGRIDDVTGWDFVNNDNNPTDDHGHGSNVTGIIAANRNNSTGVAGMIGGAKILICKILNASNSGLTSNLIAATTYARLRGVPIMNMSLQNYPFSSTLSTEFTACQTAGVLLCVCAGNQGVDNDVTPNYPSGYTHTNIISVGNHDRTDARWSGAGASNYGAVSVDLFAPGREINGPGLGTSYSLYTGTSQATPYVTAVSAAIKYLNPTWKAAEIKNSILASVVLRPAYSSICTTGGRLNAVTAVSHAVRQLPLADADADGCSNLLEYVTGSRMDLAGSRPSITTSNSGGFFKAGASYVTRPDASLQVQRSADLTNWTAASVTDFSTTNVSIGGIPSDGSLGKFLRLRVIVTP